MTNYSTAERLRLQEIIATAMSITDTLAADPSAGPLCTRRIEQLVTTHGDGTFCGLWLIWGRAISLGLDRINATVDDLQLVTTLPGHAAPLMIDIVTAARDNHCADSLATTMATAIDTGGPDLLYELSGYLAAYATRLFDRA